ncbi:hypothetical protein D3C72_699910 [compost metagenome]
MRRLDSAVRYVLNELPQVQMVGSVRALEGQFAGVAAEVNVDDCGGVRELDFKFRVDGLLWPLERAHGSAADLQHVVQQLLFREGNEVAVHAASPPKGHELSVAVLVGSTVAVRPLGVVITSRPVWRWMASTAARLLHADGCRHTSATSKSLPAVPRSTSCGPRQRPLKSSTT